MFLEEPDAGNLHVRICGGPALAAGLPDPDLIVFQGKLFIAGMTGVVLGPLALVAALVGLVVPGGHPGRYFYGVLRAGQRFESWVHLYRDADGDTKRAGPGVGLDAIADEVESVIADRAAPRARNAASR